MTVLKEESVNNLIEANNGSSVTPKQSAATNLTKAEAEETLKYLRDHSDVLCAEFHKDNSGEVFQAPQELSSLIERFKQIVSVENEDIIEIYIFWWEGNGWSIGRESNPLFIKISSQKSGQYLHSLMCLFPSYDPSRQLKNIEAMPLSYKIDIDLGIAEDIISQYSNPTAFTPEENFIDEESGTASYTSDGYVSDVDMSYVNNIDDTAQDYEVPQEEVEEEDCKSSKDLAQNI